MSTDVQPSGAGGGLTWFMSARAATLTWLAGWPLWIAALALRFALAVPFFRSGLTKFDGQQVSASTYYLFANEFKLHIFGTAYSHPFPAAAAILSSIGEIVLPILLVVGLLTRFSALGILVMTAVIQLTIPEGWANFHLPWAAMAWTLVVIGPGAISLDALFINRFTRGT
jgi:putative oxidoreductase